MNQPAQILLALACLGTLLAAYLALEIGLFRLSCRLCGVPRPGPLATLGLVAVLLVAPAAVNVPVGAVLFELYRLADYPLWEYGVVEFFAVLPVQMAVCSVLHARIMRVRVADTLAVWFVEKLFKLGFAAAAVGVVALMVLLSRANG